MGTTRKMDNACDNNLKLNLLNIFIRYIYGFLRILWNKTKDKIN